MAMGLSRFANGTHPTMEPNPSTWLIGQCFVRAWQDPNICNSTWCVMTFLGVNKVLNFPSWRVFCNDAAVVLYLYKLYFCALARSFWVESVTKEISDKAMQVRYMLFLAAQHIHSCSGDFHLLSLSPRQHFRSEKPFRGYLLSDLATPCLMKGKESSLRVTLTKASAGFASRISTLST